MRPIGLVPALCKLVGVEAPSRQRRRLLAASALALVGGLALLV